MVARTGRNVMTLCGTGRLWWVDGGGGGDVVLVVFV